MELYWEIAMEKEVNHYREALARAVLHVCRSLAEISAPFVERGEALLTASAGDIALYALREDVERNVIAVKRAVAALGTLRSVLKDKRRVDTVELDATAHKAIRQAAVCAAMGDDMLVRLADHPELRAQTDGLGGALRRVLRVLKECARLENPLQLQEDAKEYESLVHKARDIHELRPAAESLATEVMARREEWEAALTRLLRNYVPERLDTVDKSILYISLYEMLHRKLGTAIVISEAINLAHEYSGAKSAPFVHGILAAAAPEAGDAADTNATTQKA